MQVELDARERRALRRRARTAVLNALESLGGEADRREIVERAIADGAFSERELNAAPPPTKTGQYARQVDYELSWALTNLKREGLLENPRRSFWRLAGAAAESRPATLEERPPDERLVELRQMPYREYLRTPEWRRTRAAALVRAGYSCSLDVAHTENLEVHHRTYERRGEELETDVVVLCRDCHRAHHAHNGRPGKASPLETPVSVAPPGSPRRPQPETNRPERQRTRTRVSTANRRRAQNAVRELIVQLFALAGFIVGVLMGFAARPHTVDQVACRADACISAGVVAQLTPIVLYAFAGVMVGGLVGVLLALRVRLDRRP